MDRGTRQLVRTRAGNKCEYCGLPQELSPVAQLQIEHVIPRKHGGTDDEQNLALACIDCNLSKSSNLAGTDPATEHLVPLFNPRTEKWAEHFVWQGVELVGVTPTGRTTVRVLNINDVEHQRVRFASGQS